MSRSTIVGMIDASRCFSMGRERTTRRTTLRIGCDGCSELYERYLEPGTNPLAILRGARAKGWDGDDCGQSWRCPACSEKRKKTVTDFSAEALKRQKQMLDLLDMHFDIDKGRFKAGWSDGKIAEHTGLAEAAVAKARDAAYGPLKLDPATADLVREVGEARQKAESDFAELAKLLGDAKGEALTKLAAIEARLAKLIGRAA